MKDPVVALTSASVVPREFEIHTSMPLDVIRSRSVQFVRRTLDHAHERTRRRHEFGDRVTRVIGDPDVGPVVAQLGRADESELRRTQDADLGPGTGVDSVTEFPELLATQTLAPFDAMAVTTLNP